jgi:hypothetical protein
LEAANIGFDKIAQKVIKDTVKHTRLVCTVVTLPTTTTIGWEALPRYKTIIKQRQ